MANNPLDRGSHPDGTPHPFEMTVTLETGLLATEDMDCSECPNREWFARAALAKRIRSLRIFVGKMSAPCAIRATLSPKDQIMRALYAFFQELGLKNCRSTCCERYRSQAGEALPHCRWRPFREAATTLLSCWCQAMTAFLMIPWKVWAGKAGNAPAFTVSGYPLQPTADPIFHSEQWSRMKPYDPPLEGLDPVQFVLSHISEGPGIDPDDLELFIEILNLISWMSWLFTDAEYGRDEELRSSREFLCRIQRREHIRQIMELVRDPKILGFGICPSWLWSLSVANGGEFDSMLPVLRYLRDQHGIFPARSRTHTTCTEQFCMLADDDTAGRQQLHKCHGRDCQPMEFSTEALSEIFEAVQTPVPWLQSAWSLNSIELEGQAPRLAESEDSYIAISHVWSDGTGVGSNKQGQVNRCLIEYWADIARSLNCSGLWWDSICVPTEKGARRKALDIMLLNFQKAKYVIVHDNDLASLRYPGSEGAAVAVILSTWFTRSWTAAEFWSCRKNQRKVKVIFKNPDRAVMNPFLVGMDEIVFDIKDSASLAKGKIPTLPHLGASRIIQELRREVQDLRGLFRILRTRSTSWAKDRLTVASLMVLQQERVDTSRTTPEMTRHILSTLIRIPRTALFHGEVPMAHSGGWSWCPPSIFDLDSVGHPVPQVGADVPDKKEYEAVWINVNGIAESYFTVLLVKQDDTDKVYPVGSHPAVRARITEALEKPEQCLVLKVGGQTTESQITPGILVRPVQYPGFHNSCITTSQETGTDPYRWSENVSYSPRYIYCQFVGCIYSASPGIATAPLLACRLGVDPDQNGFPCAIMNAQEARTVAEYNHVPQRGMYFRGQRAD